MTIKNLDGRQCPAVAFIVIALADFLAADTPNVVDLQLPMDAQITGGDVVVSTAFDSGTTDVLDVGDPSSASRYKNDVDLKTAALTALVPTGKITTADDRTIRLTRTPVGTAATTGEVRVRIEYVQLNRAEWTQD